MKSVAVKLEELTSTGAATEFTTPMLRSNVSLNRSPGPIDLEEDGLPLDMHTNVLESWPAANRLGATVTTGVICEFSGLSARAGRTWDNPNARTSTSNRDSFNCFIILLRTSEFAVVDESPTDKTVLVESFMALPGARRLTTSCERQGDALGSRRASGHSRNPLRPTSGQLGMRGAAHYSGC